MSTVPEAIAARHAGLDVRRLIDRLVDEITRYTAKQDDDVTLVAVRRMAKRPRVQA